MPLVTKTTTTKTKGAIKKNFIMFDAAKAPAVQ
jgi:hypothetical protein